MTQRNRIRVLFVCLGNICRSPTAHGVFRDRVAAAGLVDRIEVDSAGTGDWHVGKPPDARARAAAAARGCDIGDLRARQVAAADLRAFDYVLAMDADNLAVLERLARESADARARVALFGDYSGRHPRAAVPDPYFGGEDGFERVLDLIEDAAEGLLVEIRADLERDPG
ncbi:low molecular weight protein-tyrosine-phosphatase [Salinisphaera orenii]|uniref:protein-tyrosine-phosphatase n=1 Tax=Salinisphaera orenii YIM 95161 TaxID=1051139 RepID=A0A423Q7T5_9GAMM|nr:low molecular weight protein-tyrosine-phosphatase [Salinisphaera halophila]ROO36330.1 phosphotyrosine protein phosphatase [Salinisphaera halophila YIM 95161]